MDRPAFDLLEPCAVPVLVAARADIAPPEWPASVVAVPAPVPVPAPTAEEMGSSGGKTDVSNLMTLYLRDVRRYRPLDPQAEAGLVAQMVAGSDEAREKLACHHLGLVIAMARKYADRGLHLLDLIEEGNLGMLTALEKFDASRGLRFSTYAAWWIRYYLQVAIATQVPIVRPPFRAQRQAAREARDAWAGRHGTDLPARDETAPAPVHAAAALVTALALHDEDIEAKLSDAGRQEPDIFEQVAETLDEPRLHALLHASVAELPPAQRDAVIARFGLNGGEECTLQEIGRARGVSRERARQIVAAGLEALRGMLRDAGIDRAAALS